MKDISHLIRNFQKLATEMEAGLDMSEQQCQDASRAAVHDLQAAGRIIDRVRPELEDLADDLRKYYDRICQGIKATSNIGKNLESLCNEANQILKGIEAEKQKGKNIGERIDATWDRTRREVRQYNHSMARWVKVRSKIGQEAYGLGEMMQTMRIQFSEIDEARKATYLVIDEMLAQSFKLASHSFSKVNVEAFLADEDERLARVNLERIKDSEKKWQMLLEIDLMGVEEDRVEAYAENIQQMIKEIEARKQAEQKEKEKQSLTERVPGVPTHSRERNDNTDNNP